MKVSFVTKGALFGLRRRLLQTSRLQNDAGALWLKARRGGADDGIRAMNEVDQVDAEDLTSDVSDEALEAAINNEAQPAWTTICTGVTCPG
jgi:hypothetical protein